MIEDIDSIRESPFQHVRDEIGLDLIAQIMSASDWSPATLDVIAEIIRATGREITDTPEQEQ